MGVVGADGLGQDVTHAHGFHDGTHGTTGDDTGTFGGGLQHDATSAEAAQHFVRQGAFHQRNLHAVLASAFSGLAQGFGHFLGLAQAVAHATLAVAHHHKGAEAETATALDHLGHAVQGDDLFDFAQFVLFGFGIFLTHIRTPGRLRGRRRPRLSRDRDKGTRCDRTPPG